MGPVEISPIVSGIYEIHRPTPGWSIICLRAQFISRKPLRVLVDARGSLSAIRHTLLFERASTSTSWNERTSTSTSITSLCHYVRGDRRLTACSPFPGLRRSFHPPSIPMQHRPAQSNVQKDREWCGVTGAKP